METKLSSKEKKMGYAYPNSSVWTLGPSSDTYFTNDTPSYAEERRRKREREKKREEEEEKKKK